MKTKTCSRYMGWLVQLDSVWGKKILKKIKNAEGRAFPVTG